MQNQAFSDNGIFDNGFTNQIDHPNAWNQQNYHQHQDYATSPVADFAPYNHQYGMPYNHYHPQQEGYHLHHYPTHDPMAMGQQDLNDDGDTKTEVILENEDLWKKFNQQGTEMIITRVGR